MRSSRRPVASGIVVAVLAAPAFADIRCELTDSECTLLCATMSVDFAIDASQFANPQDRNDPPRRQITTVTMDDMVFVAEAIMLPGGIVGFHEDAGEIGSRLMIVQSDGRARLTLQPANTTWVGTCARP